MLDILCVYKSPPHSTAEVNFHCLPSMTARSPSITASPLFCSCMFSVLMDTMQGWYMQGRQRDTKVRGAVCVVGVGALLLVCVLLQALYNDA